MRPSPLQVAIAKIKALSGGVKEKKEAFGGVLNGDRLVSAPYKLNFNNLDKEREEDKEGEGEDEGNNFGVRWMVIDRDTDTGDWLVISALAEIKLNVSRLNHGRRIAGCGALGFFCRFAGGDKFDQQESFALWRM
ncbi:hypothetical protein DY000_02040571 [Brassica cretica]|uniref:Uncharacterized protein n=1 Tax=Brassica cretica TaxID=69181 RepID=A0ABQ7BI00_BRACR|nr:hypothetical protein DY000_02040571 [Brassica cretica]